MPTEPWNAQLICRQRENITITITIPSTFVINRTRPVPTPFAACRARR